MMIWLQSLSSSHCAYRDIHALCKAVKQKQRRLLVCPWPFFVYQLVHWQTADRFAAVPYLKDKYHIKEVVMETTKLCFVALIAVVFQMYHYRGTSKSCLFFTLKCDWMWCAGSRDQFTTSEIDTRRSIRVTKDKYLAILDR